MHKTTLKMSQLTLLSKTRAKAGLLSHLADLREDIYSDSLKKKSRDIKKLSKEIDNLYVKNKTQEEKIILLEESNIKLANLISDMERTKIEYEKSIAELKHTLKFHEGKNDNTEIKMLKEEIERNKEQKQKDFNDKKELAKMVKKFKGEIDALKAEIKLFENNPNLIKLSESEDENCFVGFDFEIKKGMKEESNKFELRETEQKKTANKGEGKKLKKNNFDFLMETSAEKETTKTIPPKKASKKPKNTKNQFLSEHKFKGKSLKNEDKVVFDSKAKSYIKNKNPDLSEQDRKDGKSATYKKDKSPEKINIFKNMIKEEGKPQKSFFSSLNFDDSFFS